MASNNHLIAIYDFEFFPYALGDVLTWNIRTAMRCEELAIPSVDIYICVDEKNPASIYQQGLINPDNFELFFNELYSAFGTNPKLRNLYIFRQRELMLAQLQEVNDENNLEAVNDYLSLLEHKVSQGVLTKIFGTIVKKTRENAVIRKVLKCLIPSTLKETLCDNFSPETILNNYFIKYIYSHESINRFFAQKGHVPFLQPALGCSPDIDELIARQFRGKKIVPFHLRLRQLDVGYGGEHTYERDSDFLEWYDFLKKANERYPEVQFIALGRLQEKPLEILRLPNVTSLRIHGMSLGHELTLLLKSDLFVGSSSGFAALANFSAVPYFITKMNAGSCKAYAIPYGAERLPFAKKTQKLIYEQETSKLLLTLLEKGLGLAAQSSGSPLSTPPSRQINLPDWLKLHSQPFNPARTTSRFYTDENYRDEETAYLLLAPLEKARQAFVDQDGEKAKTILDQLRENFPHVCRKFTHYLLLQGSIAVEEMDFAALHDCLAHLDDLTLDLAQEKTVQLFRAYLAFEPGDEQSLPKEFASLNKLKAQIKQFNFAEVSL